jgi:hypothetical protein
MIHLKHFTIQGKFTKAADKTERLTPHYEVLVALGKDATGSFITDDDGLGWLL